MWGFVCCTESAHWRACDCTHVVWLFIVVPLRYGTCFAKASCAACHWWLFIFMLAVCCARALKGVVDGHGLYIIGGHGCQVCGVEVLTDVQVSARAR